MTVFPVIHRALYLLPPQNGNVSATEKKPCVWQITSNGPLFFCVWFCARQHLLLSAYYMYVCLSVCLTRPCTDSSPRKIYILSLWQGRVSSFFAAKFPAAGWGRFPWTTASNGVSPNEIVIRSPGRFDYLLFARFTTWSFFCVEKSFWAVGLAPHRGHGYALEEYATRRRSSLWAAA